MYMVESAPSNSCMVRSVIAHFALWRIIRAKHNMVDSGTKQSTFFRKFWYQIGKIVCFALGRLWFSAPHVISCIFAYIISARRYAVSGTLLCCISPAASDVSGLMQVDRMININITWMMNA